MTDLSKEQIEARRVEAQSDWRRARADGSVEMMLAATARIRQCERDLEELEKRTVADVMREFFGDENWDQKRYFVLTDEQLRKARARNNVYRPSFFGALIHDLLTTAAFHRIAVTRAESERDEAIAQAQQAIEQAEAAQIERDAMREALTALFSAVDTADGIQLYGDSALRLTQAMADAEKALAAGAATLPCADEEGAEYPPRKRTGSLDIDAEDSASTLTGEDEASDWSST